MYRCLGADVDGSYAAVLEEGVAIILSTTRDCTAYNE
jgi:hypothetical protein